MQRAPTHTRLHLAQFTRRITARKLANAPVQARTHARQLGDEHELNVCALIYRRLLQQLARPAARRRSRGRASYERRRVRVGLLTYSRGGVFHGSLIRSSAIKRRRRRRRSKPSLMALV